MTHREHAAMGVPVTSARLDVVVALRNYPTREDDFSSPPSPLDPGTVRLRGSFAEASIEVSPATCPVLPSSTFPPAGRAMQGMLYPAGAA